MGERHTVSDNTGQYLIANLPAGTYTISFELMSFRFVERKSVDVRNGGTVTVNAEATYDPCMWVHHSHGQKCVSGEEVAASVPVDFRPLWLGTLSTEQDDLVLICRTTASQSSELDSL